MPDLDRAVSVRLASIKGIVKNAESLLRNPTPLDGAISLILMDTALESIFKLALDTTQLKASKVTKRDLNFPTLLDSICERKELELVRRRKMSILNLHIARNTFQHQGIIPDINTVKDEYLPLVELILSEIASLAFQMDWSRISLSLLIKDEKIRRLYDQSGVELEKENYARAAAYLIYTFETAKGNVRSYLSGSGLALHRFSANEDDKDPESYMRNYLVTLDKEVETFKLGLNYISLRSYLDVANLAGVEDILYILPSRTDESAQIESFKTGIEKTLPPSAQRKYLLDWCRQMREFVLDFVITTETNRRPFEEILIKEFEETLRNRLSAVSDAGFSDEKIL